MVLRVVRNWLWPRLNHCDATEDGMEAGVDDVKREKGAAMCKQKARRCGVWRGGCSNSARKSALVKKGA